MALRDFYSLSDTPFQTIVDTPAPVSPLAVGFISVNSVMLPCTDAVLAEPETPTEPEISATHSLAIQMEQARIQLLESIITYPAALKLLNEKLGCDQNEGVEFSLAGNDESMFSSIVQEIHFVQPDSQNLAIQSLPANKELDAVQTSYRKMHVFPALLLRVAEQIGKQRLSSSAAEANYKIKLHEQRRHLHHIRQKMIAANSGLVAFVAYKHKTSSLSFDDLMQEGSIGLIKAVDRFDPNRGIRFSTYAVFWIKQAISRLILKQEKVVRLPIALAEKASAVFDAMRICYLENNRWPSVIELEAQCKLTPDEIKTISGYYQATHSLDASLSEENDDQTLMATLKQHQFALPLNELIDKNLSLYLDNVVAGLPEKEATILNMRFGLKNHTEMTLQAIADQLHVTRERVRQIQNQALQKLKQQFGHDLAPFLEANDI
jgi:RNA polymerase primary sigma factor